MTDGHETAAGPREATQTVQIIAAARFLPMLPVQTVHDGVALAADGHDPFTTPGDTIEIGKRNAVANLGCGIPADPVAAVQDRHSQGRRPPALRRPKYQENPASTPLARAA